MKALHIASIAVALASAGCAAASPIDNVVPAFPGWDEAPDDMKKGLESQVQAYIDNPDLTPQDVYAAWLQQRQSEGWTFGETLDADKKVSPGIVPWAEASPRRRMLDTMLHAAARTLKDLPDADAAAIRVAAAPTVLATPNGFVAVKYIGRRDTYKDGAYGSGIVFAKGQTQMVPHATAVQMLRHPDVYVPGEAAPAAAAATASEPQAAKTKEQEEQERQQEEQRLQDARDSINAMGEKDAVVAFVQTNFNQKLDARKGLDSLKAQAIQLVDQFGMPQ